MREIFVATTVQLLMYTVIIVRPDGQERKIHMYLTQYIRNQGDQLGSHIDIDTNTYQTSSNYIISFEDNIYNRRISDLQN